LATLRRCARRHLAAEPALHAGGDRSIRGYAWREVGPRIGSDGDRFPVGARSVATGSVEYEQYFGGPWGAAVSSTAAALNGDPEWRTGIGVGLRWKSSVGPLRIDIARGPERSGFAVPDLPTSVRTCDARTDEAMPMIDPTADAHDQRIAELRQRARGACAIWASARSAARRGADPGGRPVGVLAVDHDWRP
jgi:hypothetical protein